MLDFFWEGLKKRALAEGTYCPENNCAGLYLGHRKVAQGGPTGVDFWVRWLVNFPHRSTSCDKNIGWLAQNQKKPRLENQESFAGLTKIEPARARAFSQNQMIFPGTLHIEAALFANGWPATISGIMGRTCQRIAMAAMAAMDISKIRMLRLISPTQSFKLSNFCPHLKFNSQTSFPFPVIFRHLPGSLFWFGLAGTDDLGFGWFWALFSSGSLRLKKHWNLLQLLHGSCLEIFCDN